MKALVIKKFQDKVTGKVNQKGKTIEVTSERFEEINSAAQGPFLEKISRAKK
jgi:hypothetical protein